MKNLKEGTIYFLRNTKCLGGFLPKTKQGRNNIFKQYQIIESKSNVNPLKIDKKDYSIQEIKVEEVLKIANYLLIEEINF